MLNYIILHDKNKEYRASVARAALTAYEQENSEYFRLAKNTLMPYLMSFGDDKKINASLKDYAKDLGVSLDIEPLRNLRKGNYSSIKGKRCNIVSLQNLLKAHELIDDHENLVNKFTNLRNKYDFGVDECLLYLTQFIEEQGNLKHDGSFSNDVGINYTCDMFFSKLSQINEFKQDYASLTPLPKKPYVNMAAVDMLSSLPNPPFILPLEATNYANAYIMSKMPAEGCSPGLRNELFEEAIDNYRTLQFEDIKRELVFNSLKGMFNSLKKK